MIAVFSLALALSAVQASPASPAQTAAAAAIAAACAGLVWTAESASANENAAIMAGSYPGAV